MIKGFKMKLYEGMAEEYAKNGGNTWRILWKQMMTTALFPYL